MTQEELHEEYFDWMCRLVSSNNQYSKGLSYDKLLSYLDTIEFQYNLDMDGNRANDGIELRYRFGYEQRYDDRMIASYLDVRPCSILEMMMALAIRMEESIMDDPEYGDRTGQWFWNMIVSLGLGSMDDKKFDPDYAGDVVSRFLDRDYESDGKGGLFTLNRPNRDLRTVDIWCQMCWYLNEVLDD